MKKLLILTHNQFGYQTDTYKYCEYLKEFFDISFICFDYGKEKIIENSVNVHYISKNGPKILQLIRFLTSIIFHIRKNKKDVILLKYFPLSSFIAVFSTCPVMLAIQTGSVSPSNLKNTVLNYLLKFESLFFTKAIILSKSLRNYLHLSKNRVSIVPLGSEVFSHSTYNSEKISLLYVGSFNNRNIEKTITGLKIFIDSHNNCDLIYRIIGFGTKETEDKLLTLITNLSLQQYIEFIGLVPYNRLTPYFEKSNIGVSFIPVTPYFDIQPPTKTYEYLLSGLPVIATATSENRLLINEENGVLIEDTPEGFAYGLETIINKKYDSDEIKNKMMDYRWENIVITKLKPLVENLIRNKGN